MTTLIEDDKFCPSWLKPHAPHSAHHAPPPTISPYVRAVFDFVQFERTFVKDLNESMTLVQLCEGNSNRSGFTFQLLRVFDAYNQYLNNVLLAIHPDSLAEASIVDQDLLDGLLGCDLNRLHLLQLLGKCFDSPRTMSTRASILSLHLKSPYLEHLVTPHSALFQHLELAIALISGHVRAYPAVLKRLSSLAGYNHLSPISEVIKHDLHVSLIRINLYLEHFTHGVAPQAHNDPSLWEDLAFIDVHVTHILGGVSSPDLAALDPDNDYKVLGMRAPPPKKTVRRKASRRNRPPADEALTKLIGQYAKVLQSKSKAIDDLRRAVSLHQEALAQFHQLQLDYGAKWETHMEDTRVDFTTPVTAQPHYIKSAWWMFHEKMKGCEDYVLQATNLLQQRVRVPLDTVKRLCDNASKRVWAYHRLLEGADPDLASHELARAAGEWSEEMPILLDYLDEAIELLVASLNKITLDWTGQMIGPRRRTEYLNMNHHHHPLNGCRNADIISFYQAQFDMSMAQTL